MQAQLGPSHLPALVKIRALAIASRMPRSCAVLFFAILPVVFTTFCYGSLAPDKAISQYVHQTWRSEAGLPQDSVLAIAQTADGYIWAGTEEGLVRFDGVHFRVFDRHNTPGLTSNDISALLADKRQNLWIGTHGGGVTCFCEGKITALTSRNGLPNDSVNALYEDSSGVIWIGTDGGGLVRYESKSMRTYTKKDGLPDDSVFSIAGDARGTLWIGTHNGLSKFSEGHFQTFTTQNGLGDNYIRSTLVDRQENVWIGTNLGGLCRLNASGVKRFTTKDGLTSNTIFSIYEDRAGTLWIGTMSGGLNRVILGKPDVFDAETSLGSNGIWALLEDREGNLWAGAADTGLTCLKDGVFSTISVRDGLGSNMILPIFEDRDRSLWIGSDRGLDHIENRQITHYSTKQGLPDNLVFSVAQDGAGTIWAGTRHGLARLENGSFHPIGGHGELLSDFVMTIATDHNGDLWIGTRGGLTHYDGHRFVTYTVKDGLSNNFVLAIVEDKESNLWIGTSGGGINKFSQGRFSNFNAKNSLRGDIVRCIIADDKTNAIWLGTNGGGLVRLQDGRSTRFTSANGLFDDNVMQVLDDRKGRLWMTSNRGVFWVSKQELEKRANDSSSQITSHSYGINDGMRSKECNGGFQPAGLRARSGELYFPTTGGVSIVDPARLETPEVAPLVTVEKITLNGREMPAGSKIGAPVDMGKLDFTFTAPTFRAPDKLEFRYLLDGFEKDWTIASEQRSAHYTNLAPGEYQFRVSAREPNGAWTEAHESSVIILEPKVYQTAWFRFLVTAVAGCLSFVIHRLRVRSLKANERKLLKLVDMRTADLLEREHELRQSRDELEIRVVERTDQLQQLNRSLENEVSIRRSAELNAEAANRAKTRFLTNMSHELRTPINGIMGMTEITLTTQLTEEQLEYQEVVKSSTADLLRIVDNILMFSRIDSRDLTLNNHEFDLPTELRRSFERYATFAEKKELSFRIEIDSELPVRVIGDRNRLSEVLASLLDNALKFTTAGSIHAAARLISSNSNCCSVEFFIQDTGIGIAEKHQKQIFEAFQQVDDSSTRQFGGTGLGLAISSHLIFLMGGRIWLKSTVGEGTIVCFTATFQLVAAPMLSR